MKIFKQLLSSSILILGVSNVSLAVSQSNIKVGLAGMESDGSQVYVGIGQNPNGCLANGVYFKDQAELDKALSVALSAKMAGKTVRIDYLQPGGSGTLCLGYGIYVE